MQRCNAVSQQFKQPNVSPGTERNPERTANPMHAICHTPNNYSQLLAVLSGLRSFPGGTFGAETVLCLRMHATAWIHIALVYARCVHDATLPRNCGGGAKGVYLTAVHCETIGTNIPQLTPFLEGFSRARTGESPMFFFGVKFRPRRQSELSPRSGRSGLSELSCRHGCPRGQKAPPTPRQFHTMPHLSWLFCALVRLRRWFAPMLVSGFDVVWPELSGFCETPDTDDAK